jgi:hypothetical protein
VLLLLVPHLALVTSSPDPDETGFGYALGDVALLGLLVLTLWAFAPRLRAARSPGPVRALARTTYEHWLGAHRLTELFVAVAVTHGAIVDPVLRHSAVLRAAFVLVGVAGIGAYVYREFVAPHVMPTYAYTVKAERRSASVRPRSRWIRAASAWRSAGASSSCSRSPGSRPASVTPSRCRAAAARVSSM